MTSKTSIFDDEHMIELLRKCFLQDEMQQEGNIAPEANDLNISDMPTSLIVTSIPSSIFTCGQRKEEFEQLFLQFDSGITIQYLKSFKRARVNFTSADAAARARVNLHGTPFEDSHIKCFSIQPLKLNSSAYLQLPKPVKQFLISPPSSPPVGWEPAPESEPIINYDLLAALAALGPGEVHELHPQSDNTPGIVIHVCAGDEDTSDDTDVKISDTRSNFTQILSELS